MKKLMYLIRNENNMWEGAEKGQTEGEISFLIKVN